MRKYSLFLCLLLLVACHSSNHSSIKKSDCSYLALGDSYTIGESVAEKLTWPFLLAEGLGLPKPCVLAKTGWRTDELIQASKDPVLVADDELHPSGKMYQLWVDEILDRVKKKLP